MNSLNALVLLKALANDRRLDIMSQLVASGELNVGQINLVQGKYASASAISQHLAWLRRDGLVQTRKEAQTVFYSVTDFDIIEIVKRLESFEASKNVPLNIVDLDTL